MGNPFDYRLQKKILLEALEHLKAAEGCGTILVRTGCYGNKAGKCTACDVK